MNMFQHYHKHTPEPKNQELQQADTQPNPGWGYICTHCKHTYPDNKKYTTYPPSFPCHQMRYDTGHPVFSLKRYTNQTESCPHYQPHPDNNNLTHQLKTNPQELTQVLLKLAQLPYGWSIDLITDNTRCVVQLHNPQGITIPQQTYTAPVPIPEQIENAITYAINNHKPK